MADYLSNSVKANKYICEGDLLVNGKKRFLARLDESSVTTAFSDAFQKVSCQRRSKEKKTMDKKNPIEQT